MISGVHSEIFNKCFGRCFECSTRQTRAQGRAALFRPLLRRVKALAGAPYRPVCERERERDVSRRISTFHHLTYVMTVALLKLGYDLTESCSSSLKFSGDGSIVRDSINSHSMCMVIHYCMRCCATFTFFPGRTSALPEPESPPFLFPSFPLCEALSSNYTNLVFRTL